MSVFDIFRRKKPQDPWRKHALLVQQRLAQNGIDEDPEVVEDILRSAGEQIKINFATERELQKSKLGELARFGADEYVVYIRVDLIGRDGKVSGDASDLFALATDYAAVSKIAEKHGRSEYTLERGQRVGLGGVTQRHMLNDLLPVL